MTLPNKQINSTPFTQGYGCRSVSDSLSFSFGLGLSPLSSSQLTSSLLFNNTAFFITTPPLSLCFVFLGIIPASKRKGKMDKQKAKETEKEEEEMEFKECENEEVEVAEEEQKEDRIEIPDEIERSKVGIMRALVEREDPSSKVRRLLKFPTLTFSLYFLAMFFF